MISKDSANYKLIGNFSKQQIHLRISTIYSQ